LKILERDSYLCQRCQSKIAIQVHHLTYERLGHERLEDLISICLACHIKEHAY
jgi:5-methylcytosine-specific restriction endonuclease McrA